MGRGTAVMETPERGRVYTSDAGGDTASGRSAPRSRGAQAREVDLDPEFDLEEQGYSSERRSGGVRSKAGQRLFGWIPLSIPIPKTTWGRIAAGLSLAFLVAGVVAVVLAGRNFFVHDERFVVPSASAIEITGNTHLARADVLSVFGGDIERNIFNVSLKDRREALEALPWVEHATVMRLLPDHLRVGITERTPVAFVREGTTVGLVDAGGVLLTMPVNAPGDLAYSFPVVTGLNAGDPLSTRAARMKLFGRFTSDLDSTGEHISQKLSEVDLSDPEDVKALIPESATDILVHFGDSDFLARYEKFTQLLPEWKTQYPKLASVDMRYERQVVLEMQPGAASSAAASSAAPASPIKPAAPAPAAAATVKAAAVHSASANSAASTAGNSASQPVGSAKVVAKKSVAKSAPAKKSTLKKPWVSQWRLAHPNAPPLPAGWKPGMPLKPAVTAASKPAPASSSAASPAGVQP